MCFSPSVPKDNTAEIARQQQQQRESAIGQGRSRIEDAFSQFNEPFFQGRQQAFLDFNNPQIDDQFKDARRALTLNLSRSGNLNSGSGARQIGDLTKRLTDVQADFGNRAADFGNQSRSDVETARSELFRQNAAAADPSQAASSALARAGALGVQPSFSPIGQLFADLTDTASTGLAAEKAGFRGFNTGIFKPNNAVSVIR